MLGWDERRLVPLASALCAITTVRRPNNSLSFLIVPFHTKAAFLPTVFEFLASQK